MDWTRTTMDLNNKAVALLVNGEGDRAASILRHCLKVSLKEMLCRTHQPPILSHREDSCVSTTTSTMLPQDEHWALQTACLPEVQSKGPAQDSVFTFFNRVVIVPADSSFPSESTISHNAATAVPLYNMGISQHHKGLVTGKSKCLEMALHFYELAERTLTDGSSWSALTENTRYLLLALASNMGHIYSCLAGFEQAIQCRRFLCDLLASTSIDGRDTTMSEDEFTFFLGAAMFFQDHAMVTAPGA